MGVEPERAATMSGFLREFIRAAGGWISVERFMAEALYHPRFGYYAANARGVGRDGDFSTGATLHPALSEAVAAWATARRGEGVAGRGVGGRWHLVELGGGGGQLAESLLAALGWWGRRGLAYHVVEISPGLRAEQERRLVGRWGNRVRWHRDVGSALAAAGGRAILFSNEFVDAFPCRQWEWREAAWREVGLAWPDGSAGPVKRLGGPPALGTVGGALERAAFPDPREGQRVETHGAYRDWLARELLPGWCAGVLLTMDYGAEDAAALYHRRPRGTLRAYFGHERYEGAEVYARPGRQDLTADVLFADLRRWGREMGLREGGEPALQTQREFLRRWCPRADRRAAGDPALAFLLDPEGAGGAFRVLEQVAG